MKIFLQYFCWLSILSCNSNPGKEPQQVESASDTSSLQRSNQLDQSSQDNTAPTGTQILPKSEKTSYVNEFSPYYLKTVRLLDCDVSEEEVSFKKNNQLQSLQYTDSTLTINFTLVAICGSDFLCEVELLDGNCLNLVYHQYNSLAFCRCCYGLEYKFGINTYYDPGFNQSIDAKPSIKYVSFNGDGKIALK